MKPRPSGLWRNPHFVKLWTGQTISVFGSLVGKTALPFLAILVLNATPVHISLLNAATLIPGFLVGLVTGVWVDRLPRRPILCCSPQSVQSRTHQYCHAQKSPDCGDTLPA